MKRYLLFGSVLLFQSAFAANAPAQAPSNGAKPVAESALKAELTEAEKARIRNAIRPRESAEPAASNSSESASRPANNSAAPIRSGNPTLISPLPERVVRAVAAHKELTQFVERLMSKRAEIERWDEAAQDKFRRTFGSIDEKSRQAVLARINQQLQEATRALTALSDSIRFEFYISLSKQ